MGTFALSSDDEDAESTLAALLFLLALVFSSFLPVSAVQMTSLSP